MKSKRFGADEATLKILRLDHEGISPDFQKDVREYYFIADSLVDNLNVTAIPKNSNAIVTITGNTNLKIGKNLIQIHVISEDKTKEETYKINVTKTTNIELANANLENLAVREGFLNPEFDPKQTNYKVEISNQTEEIEILAIAQSTKAEVSIIGNDKMKVGNNTVQINVLAEDKITNKRYEIVVHRRNEQEELQYKQEQENGAEKLSAILEEQQEKNNTSEIKQQQKSNIVSVVIVIVLGSGIITGIVYMVKKKQSID